MQNSKIGLNYSLLALFLFVSAFIVQIVMSNQKLELLTIAISLTILISFILAIIGGIYLVLGLREESSKEQMIGFIISSVFFMIIVYSVIIVCKEI